METAQDFLCVHANGFPCERIQVLVIVCRGVGGDYTTNRRAVLEAAGRGDC